jgi:hypothetical protein
MKEIVEGQVNIDDLLNPSVGGAGAGESSLA